jgi:hypothetical protein
MPGDDRFPATETLIELKKRGYGEPPIGQRQINQLILDARIPAVRGKANRFEIELVHLPMIAELLGMAPPEQAGEAMTTPAEKKVLRGTSASSRSLSAAA